MVRKTNMLNPMPESKLDKTTIDDELSISRQDTESEAEDDDILEDSETRSYLDEDFLDDELEKSTTKTVKGAQSKKFAGF